jgi:hypothetical protein
MNLIFCADRTRENSNPAHDHQEIFKQRGTGKWRQAAIVSWMVSL